MKPVMKPVAKSAPTEDRLVDALAQTAFATMAVLTRIAAEHDLSLTQLRALAILRDRRLRMSQLAAYLGLDKSTLSGLIDRAERRGLVERVVDATDRRAVQVTLSRAGRTTARRVGAELATALAPLTAGLDTADRQRLQQLLERAAAVDDPVT